VRLLILASLMAAITLAGSAAADEIDCPNAAKSMTVDGSLADWEADALTFMEERDASIGLCRSDSSLYIALKLRNPRLIMRIKRGGLKLYIDPGHDKKKDFGLLYRGGPSYTELERTGAFDNDPRINEMSAEMIERFAEMFNSAETKLTMVVGGKELAQETDGTGLAKAVSGRDGTFIIYEFSLPLATENDDYPDLAASDKFHVGFALDRLKRPEDGMRGGGRDAGDRGSGGRGGGPRGGGPDGLRGAPIDFEFWLTANTGSEKSQDK